MSDLKFILGFLAGWIATTREGREAASKLATQTAQFVKENLRKSEDKEAT